jgi:hypothetical protein
MIFDEDVKQLFWDNLNIQRKYLYSEEPYPNQFFRGVGPHTWANQHPGGCKRHMLVFNKFNIIPKYCFNCYKVLIEPRTVVELFKLMMVFDKLELPNDNSRKCTVETREEISGTYKGFIVCRSVEEGMDILKLVKNVISENISDKIQATLKRGCSEYPLAYPEYARIGHGAATMEYKEQWQEYEDLADQELVINTQPPASDTYNQKTYSTRDVRVMLAWLTYAATIGDLSYLKIYGSVLQPLPDLERPSLFHPVEDD